jgi:hypothetical protein
VLRTKVREAYTTCAVIVSREMNHTTNMLVPGNHLACHFLPWVGKVTSKTEICYLELAVCRDEQIVGLQILESTLKGEYFGVLE